MGGYGSQNVHRRVCKGLKERDARARGRSCTDPSSGGICKTCNESVQLGRNLLSNNR